MRFTLAACAGLACAAAAPVLLAFPDAPPAQTTGGFGEDSCYACHFGGERNDAEGELVLRGWPERFEPGARYQLELSLERPGMAAAGFQLAVRTIDDAEQAGEIEILDEVAERVAIATAGDVLFVHQTQAGAAPDDSARTRWTVTWIAPARAEPIVVHVAAVAGDGDASQIGDHVYTLEHRAEPSAHPADAFLARIAEHCGQAFEGRIIANTPPAGEDPPADDPFVGKRLVMHVRECSDDELKVPFHVGDDRSRTWVLTRTETGVRLKHDHRHEDGSDDAVTMYGGDTATSGTYVRQEFPVDQYSIELFNREGLPASVTNVWAMEIEPNQRFMYELARPTGRLFQVEFDLTTPVAAPPTPWGHAADHDS
jgi:hypothetical protein